MRSTRNSLMSPVANRAQCTAAHRQNTCKLRKHINQFNICNELKTQPNRKSEHKMETLTVQPNWKMQVKQIITDMDNFYMRKWWTSWTLSTGYSQIYVCHWHISVLTYWSLCIFLVRSLSCQIIQWKSTHPSQYLYIYNTHFSNTTKQVRPVCPLGNVNISCHLCYLHNNFSVWFCCEWLQHTYCQTDHDAFLCFVYLHVFSWHTVL